MKGLKNYLEDFLLNNLVIDNKLQTIYNEKYGELNGIQNIISYILSDILDNNLKSIYKFIYNDITVNLYIKDIENDYLDAEYDIEKTNFEHNDIYINLKYPHKDVDDIISNIGKLIGHEILHGVEDLICHYEMSNELSNAIDNIYNAAPIEAKDISKFIYLLDYHERNAYLSQLTSDIKEIINKYNWNTKTINYKKLIEELKDKSRIWNVYFSFYDFIDKFKNDTTGRYLSQFNKIKNKHYTTQQTINELNNKFNKFKRKFENNVPKIVCDNLPVSESRISITGLEKYLF